tara:strand:- start:269 stop:418 length:150 start_codon:yes stop_codon:yes gene_type:complete
MTLLTRWIAEKVCCLAVIEGVKTVVLTVFATVIAMVCLVGNEGKPTEIT